MFRNTRTKKDKVCCKTIQVLVADLCSSLATMLLTTLSPSSDSSWKGPLKANLPLPGPGLVLAMVGKVTT